MAAIVAEKVEQAVGILRELEIDAWLTLVRETLEGGDPVLPLILGQNLTGLSAFILTREGDRIAIAWQYDAEPIRTQGVWSEVIAYETGAKDHLVETLRRLDPAQLAVNYSRDDVKADGLSHGLLLRLQDDLASTPYGDRLISAETIISKLRGRKSHEEQTRIEQAIAAGDEIFDGIARHARVGMAETEISRWMHEEAARRGLRMAWDPAHCPIVTTGADSMIGHGEPSPLLQIREGGIFHLDFGVQREDYCSDIQRCWYVPGAGETAPPEAVQRGFDTVVAAIQAAAKALRPGVPGWEVDAAARRVLTEAGYPEHQHATGHQVGRAAHDGGGLLGPRWERYGRSPLQPVEKGNVFTLELGIENLDGRGYLGLEEILVVTEDGSRFLSRPQVELPLLGV